MFNKYKETLKHKNEELEELKDQLEMERILRLDKEETLERTIKYNTKLEQENEELKEQNENLNEDVDALKHMLDRIDNN